MVETGKKTILYAPQMQTAPVPQIRPLQLKKADVLILGSHHANLTNSPPDREQEKERLLSAVIRSETRVKIFCASIGTAQEITRLISDNQLSIAVHQTIAVVNRVYRKFAIDPGKFTVFNKKKSEEKVLIFPYSQSSSNRLRQVTGLNFYVHDTFPAPPACSQPDAEFYVSRTCNASDLKKIVARVRPQEILTFGDYAKIYREEFRLLCPRVRPLFAGHQPTLF